MGPIASDERLPADAREQPLRVVVMGVSGSGKSTVGAALAHAIDAVFLDADDLHDEAARAKMTAGVPLTDADRAPWLDRVGAAIARSSTTGSVVVACSALRAAYRRRIAAAAGARVRFVHLSLDEAALLVRMHDRVEHFMPASLLASQLATLEPLEADEEGLTLSASAPVGELTTAIVRALR